MKACIRFDASLVVDVNELWSRFPLVEVEIVPQRFVRPRAVLLPVDWRLVSISTYTNGAMDVVDFSFRPGEAEVDGDGGWMCYQLANAATIVSPGERIRLHCHHRFSRQGGNPFGELHVEVPQ